MKIEKVKIGQIKSNPNNPRVIKDDKFKKLVQSVKDFPQMLDIRPIVVNDEMIVLGGNMRLKACIEAGIKEVSIIKASDLTPEQQNEFIIKDNVGFGEWNWDDLANDWDDVQLVEWGLDLPISFGEVLEAEEDDFAVPDGGIETDIVLGDLFEIGEHRLLCGDSTDSDQVAKLMNGQKADMIFTDPPYGYEYESNHYKNGNPFGMLKNDDKVIDFMPNIELFTKENAAIFICGSFQTIDKWIKIVQEYFNYKNLIVWKKNNWSMGDLEGAFAGQHELIIFAHKGRILINGKRNTDIWEYDRQKANIHPTQKPVELISFAIDKTTKQNNNILDLFLGSGTTMVASNQLKRKCYGMELDPKYCQVIIDRMKKLDPTLIIKRNGIRQS
jgi:DNA modification methylase